MQSRILIIDDEPAIVELARLYLEREGYTVDSCGTAEEGLERVRSTNPDLAVLDLMLPDGDGFDVCRRLRAFSQIPVLMLTARSEDVDKIVGLEIGADDYVTKPFNPRELVARVKAVLRRRAAALSASEVLVVGPLRVDTARHEAWLSDAALTLRAREFALLAAFASAPGRVLSRERLLDEVWGYNYGGETRTVDVHVNHLRDHLAGSSVAIETVRGTGYKLVTNAERHEPVSSNDSTTECET